jgi:hypothetical protein
MIDFSHCHFEPPDSEWICPDCGWHWEPLLAPCPACGYRAHDIPTSADSAHEDLCCGKAVGCWWAGDKRELCITHDPLTKDAPAVVVRIL